MRDFRLVVSAKLPSGGSDVDLNDTRNTIFEILSGANLFPAPMDAEDLIRWMRRLFNGEDYGEEPCRYDDSRPIGEQIIFAETQVVKSMKEMWIGGRCFRCATPKEVPPEVNAVQTNQIFGGVWGIQQDVNQYRTPFLYTLNIIYSDLRAWLHTKCNAMLQQKGVGSFARQHEARKEEHMWAAGELEAGKRFVKVMPILWVYGASRDAVSESLVRAKRLWEDCGYRMQEDRGILPIMFISSLAPRVSTTSARTWTTWRGASSRRRTRWRSSFPCRPTSREGERRTSCSPGEKDSSARSTCSTRA